MNLDFCLFSVFEFDFDLDLALNLNFYVFDLDFSTFGFVFCLELCYLGMRKFLIRRGHKLGNYFCFESPLFWLLKMVCEFEQV